MNYGKKFLILLTVALLLVMALPAAATSQPVADRATRSQVEGQTIKVGTNAEYPPFESVDADGNIIGFDVDLLSAIAADAGFEIEWVNTKWDGIFTALASGEFDAVISAATITPEREEEVDFSNPYFLAGQIISVRVADAENIATPDDLAGLRVGVQTGTTGDTYATEIPGVEVVRFDEATLAFQALGDEEIDAVIVDAPTSADIIANNPDMNLTTVGEPLTDEFYGIAVRPDFPELLDAVNASLVNVIADGTYATLFEATFGAQPTEDFQEGGTGVVLLDTTDPASVLAYVLKATFAGDAEALAEVSCEGADLPTAEDLAQFADLTIDTSGLEYTTSIDGEAAEVTLGGSVLVEGVEVAGTDIFPEPAPFVLDGEDWLFCPTTAVEPEATVEAN
ncbi:MAG: basic amino acid ABC transporter substrate-binding protein [Chloroflexi bacterium]|nr:basic amino acid ABC transporter substrate-binding protein [Chloroflexota bacterium]